MISGKVSDESTIVKYDDNIFQSDRTVKSSGRPLKCQVFISWEICRFRLPVNEMFYSHYLQVFPLGSPICFGIRTERKTTEFRWPISLGGQCENRTLGFRSRVLLVTIKYRDIVVVVAVVGTIITSCTYVYNTIIRPAFPPSGAVRGRHKLDI